MCQPQHVSAPECHLQAVYEHKGSQVQRSTSGIQHVSAQEYHLQAVYEHKSNAPLPASNMFRHRNAIFWQSTNTSPTLHFRHPTCFTTAMPTSGSLRTQVQRSTSGIQHVSAPECHLQAVYEHKSNAPLQASNMFRHRNAIFRQSTNTRPTLHFRHPTCFGTGMPSSGSLRTQVQRSTSGINRPRCRL